MDLAGIWISGDVREGISSAQSHLPMELCSSEHRAASGVFKQKTVTSWGYSKGFKR